MPNPLSIAVVGMAGVFPGASDLDLFWQNIVQKKNTAHAVPDQRWIAAPQAMVDQKPSPDKAVSRKACLITDFDFDPAGFEIDPEVLTQLDPLYHLVLHSGKTAIRHPNVLKLNKERTGVILAAIGLPTDAASLISRDLFKALFEQHLLGQSHYRLPSAQQCWSSRVTGFPAAVLSKGLGLGGGSYTLDAACASSLYALKLACDDLRSMRCDAVLAGGVSRPDCLYTQIGFSQLRALSPTGRCAPFDESADGLVVGEGCGIVVLKRLKDAIEENDTIYGVIRGIGLSNDMRGNLLAPDTTGQLRAMRSAYASAGWSPQTVDYIECHGAGTPMGDNTELTSLKTLWEDGRWKPGQCAIGSIKSMIGHLLTAAGAAGMIKTLLAIKHKTLPPSLQFSRPSANSPLCSGPFRVQTEPQQWSSTQMKKSRRAAISAFGFGGINAHLLVEEWRPSPVDKAPSVDPITVAEISASPEKAEPIAVIGMSATIGASPSLTSFQNDIFKGRRIIDARPYGRWKGCETIIDPFVEGEFLTGSYLNDIVMDTADLHIPPIEYPDILPQHLLMIKIAAEAMLDAGLPLRQERRRMGAIIGAEFDFEATDYHARWCLHQWVEAWMNTQPMQQASMDVDTLQADLQQAVSPPLTATRTLGALVSMVASRIARELRLGGPSFTVSGATNSGIRAVDIAMRMLQEGLLDMALIGAVDLCGDLRHVITHPPAEPLENMFQHPEKLPPVIPGEGAIAMVLTSLKKAVADRHRIYAVIHGIGHGNGGGIDDGATPPLVIHRVINEAFGEAGVQSDAVDYVEFAGNGSVPNHAKDLKPFWQLPSRPPVIGSLTPQTGFTGAISGLAGIAKVALALYQRLIPPVPQSEDTILPENAAHASLKAIPWPETGSETAAVVSTAGDGNVSAVVLKAPPNRTNRAQSPSLKPVGPPLKPVDFRKESVVRIVVGKQIILPNVKDLKETIVSRRTSAPAESNGMVGQLLSALRKQTETTVKAHQSYLEFSRELTKTYADNYALQVRMLQQYPDASITDRKAPATAFTPIFNREQCLEFARGKIGNVLGPAFNDVDTYPIRVRLPDEPLMLVDRILAITGGKKSLAGGTIVTEHDVTAESWYLDAGRAPSCITVEAGQADLFLCAYLGIDLAVRGRRAYRLLDASVIFHRHLPRPGETIRYEIEIERFIRQGDTYLFFFHFDGFIGEQPLISMTDGCAGFFTEEEIRRSGGILTSDDDRLPKAGVTDPNWSELIPVTPSSYDDEAVDALRSGNLGACFGEEFEGIVLPESLRLPAGRMKLIDRVLSLDPDGGRFQLGSITAEADIHQDAWFLTCHFVDDMTMPGTLMYECCLHTLRVFLLRMGWISENGGAGYEPVEGVKSILKCRGPVTPKTRRVVYQVEIKEIGFRPQPFAIADAHMFVDGQYVVRFTDMSLQMKGVTYEELKAYWRQRRHDSRLSDKQATFKFTRRQILAFAQGNPSEAFGEPYRPFDTHRFIARLPRPPYSFIHRVVTAQPEPWKLPAVGWIEAQYDVHPDDWYFRADRGESLPYCVLLEIALQACGWLAAYAGSALKSTKDLNFRNLEGQATLLRDVPRQAVTLTSRSRMTKAAMAGDTLIETFEFQVVWDTRVVYEGVTTFGFFTPDALLQQRGLADSDQPFDGDEQVKPPIAKIQTLPDEAPLTPDDTQMDQGNRLTLPAKALRMIDRIEEYHPQGGPEGLGYVRATKVVDPDEWFFRAHFHQDPVCPGSLGIESFIQLIKFMALQRWPDLTDSHCFGHLTGGEHSWIYRGQILPTNNEVTVEAVVTSIEEGPSPVMQANGWVQVDGLYIYAMKNYGLKLVD